VTMIDLKTGEMTRGLPSPNQKMEKLRDSQADELFRPVEPSLPQDIERGLGRIPDQVLNWTRDDFSRALYKVPKRSA
jgi:hypothetical protein